MNRAWVATRKGLFELAREGDAWHIARVSFVAEPVTMMLPPRDGMPMIAALNLGHFGVKCHASDDGGASWREVAAPAYPPQPEGAEGPAWKLVQIWSLAAAGGTLWAGTIPGGLFSSRDGGASWQLNDALWNEPSRTGWFGGGYDAPGIHSICIDPRDAQRLLVGISCGGAWLSQDGGMSWYPRTRGMSASYMPPERAEDPTIQDPHLIAQCTGSPEVLWCQHHCGIWHSEDMGTSWQELQAPVSSFGFAVAAHPHEAGTAWFAPLAKDEKRIPVDGAVVVNRTRDGGRTFETLRKGLPQQHAYDLVYRHGLAVADDGQTLLMGSTTGNLWASCDGGDSWQTVSTNLPPINAVRFA